MGPSCRTRADNLGGFHQLLLPLSIAAVPAFVAVATAAQRWNTSGAEVGLFKVATRDQADVVFEVDDRELGHVLGLNHRDGRACSLMSAHAFDTNCAPSLAPEPPTLDQLACGPAPADVEAAAAIYGDALTRRDVRCR